LKKELGYGSSLSGKSTYLPIVTDDEGKPAVKPDVYIDDKIYSEAEMVSIFQVSNPGRKTREEMDFFPQLTRQNADGYYIMFDRANTMGEEPLAVGRVGWKYLPEHKLYLTTGIKVIDMYRGLGLSRSLWQKRDSAVIKNTPAIGMASNFSESWLKLIQSEGWKVDPPVESLPESIQDEVRETIEGEKPRRLISKNIDMAMKKAWEILKTSDFERFLVEVFGIPTADAKILTPSKSLRQGLSQGKLTEFITENEFEELINLAEAKQYEKLLERLEEINSNYNIEREKQRQREKNRKKIANPELREERNRQQRERYANNPEVRERQRERDRKRIADPELREKRSRQRRERLVNDPKFREERNRQQRERYRRKKERGE